MTLLFSDTNCTAQGPGTRLSGNGTWTGTGLFVGVCSIPNFPAATVLCSPMPCIYVCHAAERLLRAWL